MRLGILGGTFDPVHYGHLLLAEQCREQCRLDRVMFLPAAVPPHKRQTHITPAARRVEMLELAIAGNEALEVSSLEIDRGGVNYTVETLETITQEKPEAELFFLMGADSLRDFTTWRDPAGICRLAVPVVVRREGAPLPDVDILAPLVDTGRLELIRQSQVEMPLIGISGSEIRRRVAEGRSIRYQTPRAVERYIVEHRLYQQRGEPEA